MKTNYFFRIMIAVILCSTFGCSVNTLNEGAIVPSNNSELRLKSLVQFPNNDWKGVVWEPYNYSWTNGGTANDGTDLVSAGIKWVRVWFKADYTTAQMDAMVNLCNNRGLKIIACYIKTNPEYELGTTTQQAQQVTTLTTWVNRYKTSIHYWEIHNEPNLASYWCPTCYDESQTPPEIGRGSSDPDSPYNASVTRFVAWLHLAYDAIKAADGSATVVLGGISEWVMEDWMDRFKIDGGYNYVDEIAFHPYGGNPDGVISRLTSFKNKVATWPAGKNNLPIWITEIGFHVGSISSPGQVPDEATKAAYLQQTYQLLMANLTWIRPICWYILHEVNPGSNYYNLLVRTSDTNPATLLTAYNTYKNMSSTWGGGTGTTQDNTDAKFVYTGTWATASNAGHYSGAEKEANTAGATCVYSFTGTRAEIYSYFGPWSGKCDVYVDNIWKVTIDEYSSTNAFQSLVYNTGTLTSGNHTIKLYSLGTKNASSGGYTIGSDKAIYY